MAHDREFWRGHVEAWRASGLSQTRYCQKHGLTKGTLGYWSSRLKRRHEATGLVEVGRAALREERPSRPIELVVEGRYLLRLWPGLDRDHMSDVLSVLEGRW
jgi:hypothetical protein